MTSVGEIFQISQCDSCGNFQIFPLWINSFTLQMILDFYLDHILYIMYRNLKFLQEKGPYTKSEDWKRRQYFLSASASCLNGPLLEEKIKGSSVEIDVNELSLPGETTYNNVEKLKMQFFYVVLGSCYLQEEKLQIIMIFPTCVKKN